MSSISDKLDAQDNSRRRREPGDFLRTGDGSPYWWDGDAVTAAGKPKLRRGGRASNAGYSASPAGPALARFKERHAAKGIALMMGELHRELGPYPELWDLASKRTCQILDSATVEGSRRAGALVKADRGTLLHEVLERVALDVIAGGTGRDVALSDLEVAGLTLGVTMELLEAARDIFAEFFATTAIPLAAETKAVHPEYNLCGTADLVLEWLVPVGNIDAGTITGADLKTGKVADYTAISQCAQLAGYFGPGSKHYLIADDAEPEDPGVPVDWPWPISTELAVVLHMPLDDALSVGDLRLEIVVADLVSGRQALDLAAEVNSFKLPHALDFGSGVPKIDRQLSDSSLLANLTASVDADLHERVLEWLHQRLAAITESRIALDRLLELWPVEVDRGAIRDRTLAPEHVAPISRLFDHIEAEASLPFPPRDPRADLTGSRSRAGSTGSVNTTQK